MLHRVYPFESDKLMPNESMKITPEYLDKLIIEFQSRGYEIISINRLYDILTNEEKIDKQIVFTFDDGYKDNYTYAYPVFKKHNISFTVYITTSLLNRDTILWWHALEDLILENEELVLSGNIRFKCKTFEEKTDTFFKIRKIILSLNTIISKESLNELFALYKVDWSAKCEELAMTWDELIKLSQDNIVTIGSHTNNHFPLNRLNKEEILKEIQDSNSIIETHINKKVEHFAYPFGTPETVGKKEILTVKDLNFKTATTTRNGTVYLEHKKFMYCLPRIMLTEKFKFYDLGRIRKKKIVTL